MSTEALWLAVVISANVGLQGEVPLHFADEDADELVETLEELGDLDPEGVFRARAAHPGDVTDALQAAVLRSSALRQEGRRVRLLVYYTGHASTDGLHLSGEVMSLDALKTAARVVPADERVFAVDACQSGTLFRTKGPRVVDVSTAPATFTPPPDEAWITSAGAEERAFEVDQRRGSLFTHFFVSGLRGAADADRDASVTLGELFHFVSDRTEAAAAELGHRQTPQWSAGFSELVLARVDRAPAALELVGPVSQPLLVVDRDTARVVAEMPVGSGGRLGVPAGRYQLLSVGSGRTRVADIVVHEHDLERVEVATRLADASGVRSKGGLVVQRPWRGGAGVVGMTGAAPGLGPELGLALRVDRELGRGHDVGVVVTGLSVADVNPQATVSSRRLDVGVDWSVDAAWRRVRLGPGVRLSAGWLHQAGARRDDGPWGDWDAGQGAPVTRNLPTSSALALARLAVPRGRVELHATVGAGPGVVWSQVPQLTPVGQATFGLSWGIR